MPDRNIGFKDIECIKFVVFIAIPNNMGYKISELQIDIQMALHWLISNNHGRIVLKP